MADRERDRPPRRLQTPTDREAESARGLRDRAEYARASSPPVDFESVTGVLQGDALRLARADRSVEERLERGENKQDELGERVSKLEGVVSGYGDRLSRTEAGQIDTNNRLRVVETGFSDIGGQLKILPQLVDTMNKSIDALQKERHVVVTTQLDLGKEKALADLEVGKQQAMAIIDKGRDEHQDTLAERRARRKRSALIVSGIIALFSSGGLLTWLLQRYL